MSQDTQEDQGENTTGFSPSSYIGATVAGFGTTLAWLTAPSGLTGAAAVAYAGFAGACAAVGMWLGAFTGFGIGMVAGQIAYARARKRSEEPAGTPEEELEKENISMSIYATALGYVGAFAGSCVSYSLSKDWLVATQTQESPAAQRAQHPVTTRLAFTPSTRVVG